jgi:DNA-binding FadR family transcriptional regulator
VEETALGGAAQLPPEPKLAEQLQISRGRLRTLLKHLESEGLIWRHVGKGTFLGPRELDPRSPEWLEGISFGDIMDARRVLEPQLAAHAAIRAKPTDIAALDRCIAEMKSAPSFFLWKRLDERLHRLIAEATHNSLLLLLYETLRTQGRSALDTRLQEVLGHETAPAETNRQHEAIVAAIKSGNPDFAEEAMRDHIARVRAELFGRR